MIQTNWDAPIRKVPLEYNGTKSNAWSVQREDIITTKTEDTTINGPVWNEVGVVSDNYLLIPNKKVVELANDVADNSGLQFEEDKIFYNGRQFMYSMVSKDTVGEVEVGDDVGLGIMFWNSYDGSTALSFRIYLQRLACLNGMVSKDIFKSYRFRHLHNSDSNYEAEILDTSKMINTSQDNVRYFINGLRQLGIRELDMDKLSFLRKKYLSKLPTSLFGNIMDKFLSYKYQKPTIYDLLNASTNVLWHKEKQTKADFDHNAYIVDNLIEYTNHYRP